MGIRIREDLQNQFINNTSNLTFADLEKYFNDMSDWIMKRQFHDCRYELPSKDDYGKLKICIVARTQEYYGSDVEAYKNCDFYRTELLNFKEDYDTGKPMWHKDTRPYNDYTYGHRVVAYADIFAPDINQYKEL